MFFRKPAGVSWIIACLGNPGIAYERTRHNVGFLAAAALAEEKGIKINKSSFRALTGCFTAGGEKVLVMKPQTYMNSSGEAVAEAARFYKIPADHIIVISDETALAPGKIRVRASGSAGGHNGLKSIISCLGSDGFPRIRIGIGKPDRPDCDMKDWVLGRFTGKDLDTIQEAAKKAAAAAEFYIEHGCAETMNRFN